MLTRRVDAARRCTADRADAVATLRGRLVVYHAAPF